MKKYWTLKKKFPKEYKKIKRKFSPMKTIWDYMEEQRKTWKEANKFFEQ